jgi:two-component system cell cycle sensor histidine kinase/response regulator CckA
MKTQGSRCCLDWREPIPPDSLPEVLPMPVPSTTPDHRLPELKLTIPKDQPKVMVVEDEAIIAFALQRQLIGMGFAATRGAQTAQEAFHLIEQESPDLVLMDIRLKGDMDGVQTASIIRSRYRLPVIYLTAFSDDATLDRARMTEPYGFLVKPIEDTALKAAISMALYKHQMERRLETNRRLLSTILQSLADAIIVTHPTGEVLFLNRAAEQITGWNLAEVSGKNFFQIATIHDDYDRQVSSLLLQEAIVAGAPIPIPHNRVLITRDGQRIGVSGQLSVMTVDGQPTGVFISLQDIAAQEREGQVPNQERHMRIVSQFAEEVGCVFDCVFDLIDNAVNGLRKEGNEELDLIRNATRVGSGISAQLLEMGEGSGAAHVVNVKEYLLSSQSLWKRLCTTEIQLELSSSADLGYILGTGNHFEQLLVNLVHEGGQQLDGQGSLLLGADVQTQSDLSGRSGSYVRLFLKVETPPAKDAAFEESSTFGPESPQIGLAIMRAIAAASGGFVRLTQPSRGRSMIEVFLPRHPSRISATTATNEHSTIILLVGLEPDIAESLKRGLKEVLFIEATTPDEAECISELYEGDIDLIILDEGRFERGAVDRARSRIGQRRPGISFMQSSGPVALEQRVMNLLDGRMQAAVGSAN